MAKRVQESLIQDLDAPIAVKGTSATTLGAGTENEARRANDLDGKEWTKHSISIWSDIRKTPEEMAVGHPAMFPLRMVSRLIEAFTRAGATVLDPFVGVGSTVIAAKQLGRHGIGVELSSAFLQIAKERELRQGVFEKAGGSATFHLADARELDRLIEPHSVDLVVTSPPYWDILEEKRTADYKPIRNYGNEEKDLGKIDDYKKFLRELQNIFGKVYLTMKPGAYCCVIVMDLRKKAKFYPFHSDLAQHLEQIGFEYDDLIIWDRRHEYNNLRPLGYPTVFRINKVHEFILVFKK